MAGKPKSGLMLMVDPSFEAAARPLFDAGEVESVDWSIEFGWGPPLSPFLANVLREFGAAGRLYGHGLGYSLFSRETPDLGTAEWLARARDDHRARGYRAVSEHYGLLAGEPKTPRAPFPIPPARETVALGIERLGKLRAAIDAPVGLENLALAWSREGALLQGPLLATLLDAVDGFLLLDLHNVHCQLRNFALAAEELLPTYPLDRVKQIHVSGGSDVDGVRRDTHDGGVPRAVFDLLEKWAPRCPKLESVTLEQMGTALREESARARFREDFGILRAIGASIRRVGGEAPTAPSRSGPTLVGAPEAVSDYPAAFERILRANPAPKAMKAALIAAFGETALGPTIREYDERMLAVGRALLEKWGTRAPA